MGRRFESGVVHLEVGHHGQEENSCLRGQEFLFVTDSGGS